MIFTFSPSAPSVYVEIPFACSSHNSVHSLLFRSRRRNIHSRSWTTSSIFHQKSFLGPKSLFRAITVSCLSKEEIESRNDFGISSVISDNCMSSTRIAKSLFVAFFCISIGLLSVQKLQFRALDLSFAAAEVTSERHELKYKNPLQSSWSDHDYTNCTRRLLDTASGLLSKIEAKPDKITDVGKALKEVETKKRQLEDEIMDGLSAEVKLLKSRKHDLNKRSCKLLISLSMMRWEIKILLVKASIVNRGNKANIRIRELEDTILLGEKEFEEIRNEVGEIEDLIVMKERMAIDVGVRELNLISKQCEGLVEALAHKIWSTKFQRFW